MSSNERSLIRKADYVDRLLDEGLGLDETGDSEMTTWEELLRRNEIEPPKSRLGLATLDKVVYCATGIAGGVLNLTQSYSKVMTNEGLHQKFNKLSNDYIEKVTGQKGITSIDNYKGGGVSHRLVGPGHDLTRFFETIAQMMCGEFLSNVHGVEHIASRYRTGSAEYLPIEDPVDAAIILILHLIGDFFSKQSLPIPGRTRLAESECVEVVREVFKEFRNGDNLRKQVATFLSNLSSAIFISLVLRLYRYMDLFIVESQKPGLKQLQLGEDFKYHLLNRNAQTIAFVISTGRAVFSGNPADVNYLSFIQVVRSGASINRLSLQEQDNLLAEFSIIRNQVAAL